MTVLGQLCLLTAFGTAAYAAFAGVTGALVDRASLRRGGITAGLLSVVFLTLCMGVLSWALLTKNFSFSYVARYSSRLLPWYYSLSALWVGQAGSLLLWSWILGLLGVVFWARNVRHGRRTRSPETSGSTSGERLSTCAFGLLMGYVAFLAGMMIFAADPMEPSVVVMSEGTGLSPLLQHPAMLIHPPVVFLGYAGWAVPCALTLSALALGQLDHHWLQLMRPWALFSWAVLGAGILLGAQWSYEELGWGGYWAWDPVENASLIPWLTGTAFIHALMAWRYRGLLKKTVVVLAIGTFALCNFATFLTRSGIFSSLHAFSRSPIGWLFLGLMFALGISGVLLMIARRSQLASERRITSFFSCEAMVCVSSVALLLLAGVVLTGTLFVAVSEIIVGRRMMVGTSFYNNALTCTGVFLLASMAPAPLLQWGSEPSRARKAAMLGAAFIASVLTGILAAIGARSLLTIGLTWVGLFACFTLAARIKVDMRRRQSEALFQRLINTVGSNRRQYAGFIAHLGLFCLTLGLAGSSLGSQRGEFQMAEGETVNWAGLSIKFDRLHQISRPDKLIVSADLTITHPEGRSEVLVPAQHHHRLQETWTTEPSIARGWNGDLYTILHNGDGSKAHFTFVVNPLMRCLWLGGWTICLSVLVGLCPKWLPRRRAQAQAFRPAGHASLPHQRGAASRKKSPASRQHA